MQRRTVSSLLVVLALVAAGVAGRAFAASPDPPAPVNVNTASETQLMTVPGVTRDVARRIVQHRPFASIDQLIVEADLPAETVRVAHTRFTLMDIASPPARTAPTKAPASSPASRAPLPPLRAINVNRASREELMESLQLDRHAADRVVLARPYTTISEFLAVAHLAPSVAQAEMGRLVVSDAPVKTRDPSAPTPADPRTLDLSHSRRSTPIPARPLPERLDINAATVEQLQSVCGIGSMEAREIVQFRPFRSVGELGPRLGYSKAQIDAAARCLRVAEPAQ